MTIRKYTIRDKNFEECRVEVSTAIRNGEQIYCQVSGCLEPINRRIIHSWITDYVDGAYVDSEGRYFATVLPSDCPRTVKNSVDIMLDLNDRGYIPDVSGNWHCAGAISFDHSMWISCDNVPDMRHTWDDAWLEQNTDYEDIACLNT